VAGNISKTAAIILDYEYHCSGISEITVLYSKIKNNVRERGGGGEGVGKKKEKQLLVYEKPRTLYF
jgi:hypothetical protein